MNILVQNLAVTLIVGGCIVYVGWQVFQALRGRKSKLGSCCAKGCSASEPATTATGKVAPTPAPVQFLPLANLGLRSSKR